MLDETTMHDAMNEQIKNEFYSAYLYLSMSAYFETINLPGFAHWMQIQVQEEVGHAMKLYNFINERGGRVVLQAIDQPPAEFDSPLDVFERTLEHEEKVTGMIHQLYALSIQEQDYPSQIFLQWFVTEQVEEEDSVTKIMATLKLIGDDRHALLMLDRELGSRVLGPASQQAE